MTPTGTPSTLFAMINCHLAKLSQQGQAIPKEFDIILALFNNAQVLVDEREIDRKVSLAVRLHTSQFSDLIALVETNCFTVQRQLIS
jgi:hypothetical protein